MRRAILATALAATMLGGCSMTPRDVRPVSAVPPSWPVGDAYLRRSEANLPVVSYAQVFRDTRRQRLIERIAGQVETQASRQQCHAEIGMKQLLQGIEFGICLCLSFCFSRSP